MSDYNSYEGYIAEHHGRCNGTLCALCLAPIGRPVAGRLGFRYCSACVLGAPKTVPHAVRVNIRGTRSCWSVHFCDEDAAFRMEPDPLRLWLLPDSIKACLNIVRRGRYAKRDMRRLISDLNIWGQSRIYVFLDDAQYKGLIDAGRRDPRTAYEKLKALDRR